MSVLIVVSDPADWKVAIPGTRVVPARDYLTDEKYAEIADARVFNLCRTYRYQRLGYYVSLVADARGHRPFPTTQTIQALKSKTLINAARDDLQELVQKSLKPLTSDRFVLSVYFGKNLADRHSRLAGAVFREFPAPLLRATFHRSSKAGKWVLDNIDPLATTDVPEDHWPFLSEVAKEYFGRRHRLKTTRRAPAYDLAILVNAEEAEPPSDAKAISKFTSAGRKVGFDVELLDRHDYHRLAEFDALFIRETTSVNHHTFRFAQKAAFNRMVVIDDPISILRCTNKVYLAELLTRHGVPAPRTITLHRGNAAAAVHELGLPCILKQPDSSFSQGVVKAETEAEFHEMVADLLSKSDLVLAQEYRPTDYDWRIGILGRRPLYACKYYMAAQHWQIIHRGDMREGDSEGVPLDGTPKRVVAAALKAANLIGDGLYGVDVKEIGGRPYVIEVNDNPSIDSGCEDALLGDTLYLEIARHFRDRLEARRRSP